MADDPKGECAKGKECEYRPAQSKVVKPCTAKQQVTQ